MRTPSRILPLALLLTVAALAAPACATQGALYRYPVSVRVDERAYDRGYEEGRKRGERDARRHRPYDYARHDEYRDADEGYRGYGDRSEYRHVFRRGFIAGYDHGYRMYARDGYGRPGPYPAWDPDRDAAHAGAGVSGPPASRNGYRDGYDQGMDDARHRRPFDPIVSLRYREGDHDYDGRYGPREEYKRDYRAAFQHGYEQGYRSYRG